ncbi:hypothetical protein I215_04645 [Galbibacter marinus]|uniref:Lipoprotein n=1 Tax=Galbibacter marinus TaxID=555500 RepID=K2Q4S7_9FLAO|nr:hypothetical protein [Galbibacter marinus]EKF55811.1 hypothetical protein I215_04645 [Galbibacter marinus]
MKKIVFIISIALSILACDNDHKKANSHSATDSLALQQKEPIRLSDDELVSKLLRIKNSGLNGSDSVYYRGVIKRPSDSSFTALNLYGKTKQENKLKEFKQTAILKNQQTVTSDIQGSVFRIDQLKDEVYKIYTYESDLDRFVAYDIDFDKEPVSIKRSLQTGNFYYDLLPKKEFKFDIDNIQKYFNSKKDQRITDNPILDSISYGALVYTDQELLRIGQNLKIDTYYYVLENSVLEKLIVHSTKGLGDQMTLSGQINNPKEKVSISSIFKDDQSFQQTELAERLQKDSKHLVSYTIDSVIKNYQYNKEFEFTLKSIDSFQRYENYPQYYPNLIDSTFYTYSKDFEMNNEKLLWRYSVRYTRKTNTNPNPIEVSISSRELIRLADSSVVFEAPLAPIKKPSAIAQLSQHEFNPRDFDINFDGYNDLSFPDGYDLNRNATHAAYIYDPQLKTYLKNDTLTGPSLAPYILLDKDHKLAIYTAKIGADDYSVRIVNMLADGKGIAFRETYWSSHANNKISINYQKTVSNAVVEQASDVANDKQWSTTDFKNQFLSWVSNQIGKNK